MSSSKEDETSEDRLQALISVTLKIMRIGFIVLILLLVGGGVAYAAEDARPGQALYSVKIGINEKVASAFAVSDQAKIALNARLANRRLEEAEQVTLQSKLTTTVREQLEKNFKEHSDRVQERSADFNDRDLHATAEVIANFETSLAVHEKILAELASKTSDTAEKTEVEDLGDEVKKEGKQTADLEDSLEAKISASPDVQAAAEGRLTAAVNKINEVRRFIERVKTQMGASAVTAAEVKLTASESKIAEGKAKLAAKEYAAAFKLFSEAHQIAQEAKELAQVRLELKIDGDNDRDDELNEDKDEVEVNREVKVEDDEKDDDEKIEVNGEIKVEINMSR